MFSAPKLLYHTVPHNILVSCAAFFQARGMDMLHNAVAVYALH
jgi:hypothetical protein